MLPPPVWVQTIHQLKLMVRDLATQQRVAVDTESNSLHAFREQVCLLQFSSPCTDYLVDPLALQDLSLLAPIFANPGIEKVFHAAEYDLICLRRDFGFSFSNLFDTMQAARVLGYPAVGLDRLLGDRFDIKMDKRHQKANWAARPLSQDQIHYARLDTHYLCNLRDVLEQELRDKDRLMFALEDFRRACFPDEQRQRIHSASWERFTGRKDLSLRELTSIYHLCQWRDAEAEKLNRPAYKVVMDEVLLSLSKNPPEKTVDLSAAGLSEKQIKLWGRDVINAIQRGMEAPLVERKQAERKDDAVLRRLEKLKAWRKKEGMELKVESDIILPKPYLGLLSEHPPRSLEDLRELMHDSPSRVERFGLQILKTLGVKHAD